MDARTIQNIRTPYLDKSSELGGWILKRLDYLCKNQGYKDFKSDKAKIWLSSRKFSYVLEEDVYLTIHHHIIPDTGHSHISWERLKKVSTPKGVIYIHISTETPYQIYTSHLMDRYALRTNLTDNRDKIIKKFMEKELDPLAAAMVYTADDSVWGVVPSGMLLGKICDGVLKWKTFMNNDMLSGYRSEIYNVHLENIKNFKIIEKKIKNNENVTTNEQDFYNLYSPHPLGNTELKPGIDDLRYKELKSKTPGFKLTMK